VASQQQELSRPGRLEHAALPELLELPQVLRRRLLELLLLRQAQPLVERQPERQLEAQQPAQVSRLPERLQQVHASRLSRPLPSQLFLKSRRLLRRLRLALIV
jgi:hypothetical protein